MDAIPVERLKKFMQAAEDLNDGNYAACWASLKITLDELHDEAAQTARGGCVHGFAEGKCVHETCINHPTGLRR